MRRGKSFVTLLSGVVFLMNGVVTSSSAAAEAASEKDGVRALLLVAKNVIDSNPLVGRILYYRSPSR